MSNQPTNPNDPRRHRRSGTGQPSQHAPQQPHHQGPPPQEQSQQPQQQPPHLAQQGHGQPPQGRAPQSQPQQQPPQQMGQPMGQPMGQQMGTHPQQGAPGAGLSPQQGMQGGARPATPPAGQMPGGAQAGMQAQPPRQGVSLKPIRLEDVLQEDVVTAESDTPIRTIAADLAEHDVGSVVVTEDDAPTGIITDRKIALALEKRPDIAQQEAQELVDGDLTTVDPSMTIFDALQLMSDENIRRLPVVDDNGKLKGIVTLDDALVLLGTELGNAAEVIQAQSPRL